MSAVKISHGNVIIDVQVGDILPDAPVTILLSHSAGYTSAWLSYVELEQVRDAINAALQEVENKAREANMESQERAAVEERESEELAAMQQSCRDLATRFNANSEKANKAIFKGNAVPQTLETSQCDA